MSSFRRFSACAICSSSFTDTIERFDLGRVETTMVSQVFRQMGRFPVWTAALPSVAVSDARARRSSNFSAQKVGSEAYFQPIVHLARADVYNRALSERKLYSGKAATASYVEECAAITGAMWGMYHRVR